MAERIVGYGLPVVVSDNGAGFVRVTFAADDLDKIYVEGDGATIPAIPTDGSWYLANVTRTVSAAITAKGGTESGGYYFDLGGVAFPSANWVTGDGVAPVLGAAINVYLTITLANVAAANGDRILPTYMNAAFTITATGGLDVTGKAWSFWPLLAKQRFLMYRNTSNITFSGDLSGQATVVTAQNFRVNNYVLYNPGAGLSGAGFRWSRIVGYGPAVYLGANARGTFSADNIFVMGANVGVIIQNGADPMHISFSVALQCTLPFSMGNNAASTIKNTIVRNCGAFSSGTVTITYCAYDDALAGATNLQNQTPAQLAMWNDNDNHSYVKSGRILTTSTCYQAGTPIAGVPIDIDGTPRNAVTPSIGCHEGSVNAYGVTWPTNAQVETGVTFTSFAGAQTGTMPASAPLATFSTILSASVVAAGSAVTVTGGVTLDQAVTGAAVTLKRYAKSGGALLATVVNAAAVDFSAGVQKTWAQIAGAAVTITPTVAREEYLVADISGGTPAVTTETSGQVGLVVVSATRPSWSAEPTAGDGQVTLHLTAASETDVLYPVWRTGSGEFTEPSEDFKRTGSGDLVVTGLANGDHHGFLAYPKDASGLWGLPTLEEAYATPRASGAVAASGPLSLPVHYLRLMVAASAAWQALVGAADSEEALDSVLPVESNCAAAAATVTDGAVSAIAVTRPGRGYRSAPAVTVVSPSGAGTGATATASVAAGKVTGIEVDEGGDGYSAGDALVRVAAPPLPLCIVDWMPDWGRRSTSGGGRNYFEGSGQLLLLFRLAVNSTHDEQEAAYTAQNALGAVLDDIESLAGVAGYLDISEIRQVLGPARANEDEAATAGDHYMVAYSVSWVGGV